MEIKSRYTRCAIEYFVGRTDAAKQREGGSGQEFTLHTDVGYQVCPARAGRAVGVVRKQFRYKRHQRGRCITLCIEITDDLVANGNAGRVGKGCLVEGVRFDAEEHAHQRGEAATQ